MSLPTPNTFTNALALSSIIQMTNMLETRLTNSVSGQVQFIGYTNVAAGSTAEAIWYVLALSYDVNGFLNHVQLPNNGPGFIYIFDNVATYF